MKTKLSPSVLKVFKELGRVGGQTRAKNLTAEKRRDIARKAAAARWTAKRKP